jgi:aspartate kinase
MSLIVQKFGGTSVADVERINSVANLVQKELGMGNKVVVVLSAMAGVTNHLVGLANQAGKLQSAESWQEYDVIVSTGEQVTTGLLALILQSRGLKAHSWQGWQLPIETDEAFGKARITNIDTAKILERIQHGEVVIVPGFQGVTKSGRVTTLGRGGSDTSAVALAAALHAERCDIYTDVDGVYTCDPRIVTKARKLKSVTYEEMLEMASQGAKVLQTRSVEMAMNHGVRVQVLSSFANIPGSLLPGTLLVNEEEVVEKSRVTGIAYSRDEARVTLAGVANSPGVAGRIFGGLADNGINVDMIVQNVTEDGRETDMTFTVSKADLNQALNVIKKPELNITAKSIHTDSNVAKVSVIGVGMRSHAGVAKEMFTVLGEKNINIQVISTSEIKISVLIAEEYTELALRALHTVYGLDAVEEVG